METGASPTGAPTAERTISSHQRANATAARRNNHAETTAQNDRNARISNRQWQILEFAVTARKQTTAPHSNRHFFRVVNVANRAIRIAGFASQTNPNAGRRSFFPAHRISNRNNTAFKNVANSINPNEKAFSNRNTNPFSANHQSPLTNHASPLANHAFRPNFHTICRMIPVHISASDRKSVV